MASNIADYGKNAYLGLIYNGTALPASFYIALLVNDADVGYDGTILQSVEVPTTDPILGATNYSRKAAPIWTTADGGFVTSSTPLDFGIASVSWGVVTGWAIVDSATTGNLYVFGDFANSQLVAAGNQFIVPAGGLTVTMSGFTAGIVV